MELDELILEIGFTMNTAVQKFLNSRQQTRYSDRDYVGKDGYEKISTNDGSINQKYPTMSKFQVGDEVLVNKEKEQKQIRCTVQNTSSDELNFVLLLHIFILIMS